MGIEARGTYGLYPDYTAQIAAIEAGGITPGLLRQIVTMHLGNAEHTRGLYGRYRVMGAAVPIFSRQPRFEEGPDTVNNKLNHDFFGEIIDFKTGYFAGKPIVYSYSGAQESKDDTGGKNAVDQAAKALSDFVVRNNMHDADMEATRIASACGYCGRLMYIDPEGEERIKIILPYNAVLLFRTDMTEPEYGVHYYRTQGLRFETIWRAEFYGRGETVFYEGSSLQGLNEIRRQKHCFDYCPLQGIPNNRELMGDAERVLSLIDGYDRVVSDNSNELEGSAHAYMEFCNTHISDDQYARASKTGAFEYQSTGEGARIGFITKDVNDTYNQNHLDRLRDNIYKFSATLNLSDESFGTASGVSLKFKLTGVEAKCGLFQAKMQAAGAYMFKLLSSSWKKKSIAIDPLQCFMTFKRNFPLDMVNEAQAVQMLIAAGLPKRIAFECLSWLDDMDYVMQLIDEEQDGIPALNDLDGDEDDERENV